MSLPIELLDETIREARVARQWYHARSAAAADRFMLKFDQAIAEIAANPLRWPTYLHSTRRYRLQRFPYLPIYRVTHDSIQIIACAHTRRRPGYWRSRG